MLKLDHILTLCRRLDLGPDRGENIKEVLESSAKYGLYPHVQIGDR